MSQEIEEAALSVGWQSESAWGQLRAALSPDHFTGLRADIFRAMKPHKALDQALVLAELERVGKLEAVGGRARVAAFAFNTSASSAYTERYIADLEKAMARRASVPLLKELVRMSENSEVETPAFFDRLERNVLSLTRSLRPPREESVMVERVGDAFKHIDERMRLGNGLAGIDTGLDELNRLFSGLELGAFTVILGLPAAGKTALWLQMATHVARTHSPVAMVELEMSDARIALRQLTNQGRVDYGGMTTGRLNDHEYQKLADAAQQLINLPNEMYVAGRHIRSISDIERWFRAKHADSGVQTLWIDNIKIVEGLPGQSELERFNTITRSLKLLAADLNIHICAIHHIRKLPEHRKKITLDDAYGSSSIRQDADNILLMHTTDLKGVIELESGKSREVEGGHTAEVEFIGKYQRFEPFIPTSEPEPAYAYADFEERDF